MHPCCTHRKGPATRSAPGQWLIVQQLIVFPTRVHSMPLAVLRLRTPVCTFQSVDDIQLLAPFDGSVMFTHALPVPLCVAARRSPKITRKAVNGLQFAAAQVNQPWAKQFSTNDWCCSLRHTSSDLVPAAFGSNMLTSKGKKIIMNPG